MSINARTLFFHELEPELIDGPAIRCQLKCPLDGADGHLRAQRLAGLFGVPQPFGMLRSIGERNPRSFGPAATLAHMVERCRFRIGASLCGACTKELKVRCAGDWS